MVYLPWFFVEKVQSYGFLERRMADFGQFIDLLGLLYIMKGTISFTL